MAAAWSGRYAKSAHYRNMSDSWWIMSASIEQAVHTAHFLARYALDRERPATQHPGVRPHLVAALAQLNAVIALLEPDA
jgi:hypothetical protein